MDKNTPRGGSPSAKSARVALNVLALCFVLSVFGRGLGESFTVFLKPISESFGWDRAQVVSVYSLTALAGGLAAPLIGRLFDRSGPRSGLFARTVAARRRVPGRSPFAISLAVPAEPRALRRHRHRLHRQRAELDPARPLVRPAVADRDGRRLFRHRRGRPDPAAGIADPDRPYRLARRLSGFRHRLAAPAGAAVAAAVAAVLHRFAASGQERRRRFRRRRLDAR